MVEHLRASSNGQARAGRLTDSGQRRPAALVVHPRSLRRIELRRRLEEAGYDVATCTGPGMTYCRGVLSCWERGCPRFPDGVEVVVLAEALAPTRLAESYAVWAPSARIFMDTRHGIEPIRNPVAPAPGAQGDIAHGG